MAENTILELQITKSYWILHTAPSSIWDIAALYWLAQALRCARKVAKKSLMQTLYPFICLTAVPKGTTREQSPFVLSTVQTREWERLTLPKKQMGVNEGGTEKGNCSNERPVKCNIDAKEHIACLSGRQTENQQQRKPVSWLSPKTDPHPS